MRSLRVAPIALGALLLLVGCTGIDAEAPEAPEVTASVAAPSASTAPSLSPTASTPGETAPPTADAAVDCDTMIDAAVAAQYRVEGLAPLPKPFLTAHGVDVEGGISCPWGPAGAPGQQATHVYSWGPLEPGRAAEVIDELQAREPFEVSTGEGGTYLSTTYSDGPGAVFFVTDRSIRFAETREALRNIVWVG
ncbi:hypothetical protein DEU34_1524 [Microbacterium sp. AG1240]|uniref:hypothetical protein n=1 Tax=Microbacterium sp. AG1240 TaxID=2183992 RepID=UPI000F14B02D|nr:hypothetical protein [Microbacterium sp. AG1240]RKT36986.1 hypothetical protein DEU34_1524 [Microbacterium sp. AG1240]